MSAEKTIQGMALAMILVAVSAYLLDFQEPKPELDAARVKETCGSSAVRSEEKENCYAKEFSQIAFERGADFAFATLRALQKKDSLALGCHLIAHGVGEGLYRRAPVEWQKNIQGVSRACGYGAMHGLIESYAATLPEKSFAKEVVPEICGENPRANCNHIVGHLLLVEAGADIDEALELCRVFESKPAQLEHCYTGVFMEHQTALNLIAHGLASKSWLNWPSRFDELKAVCLSYEGLEAESCWRELTHVAAAKFSNDPEKIFTVCDEAPVDARGKKECKFHAIGIIAAASKYRLENLGSMCEIPSFSDFRKDCYIRLGVTTISNLPDSKTKVENYCTSVPAEYQKDCFDGTNSIPPESPTTND